MKNTVAENQTAAWPFYEAEMSSAIAMTINLSAHSASQSGSAIGVPRLRAIAPKRRVIATGPASSILSMADKVADGP